MRTVKSRTTRVRAAVVLLTIGLLTLNPAWAEVCVQPHENAALNTRVLQTELMVAALACGNRPLYNAFVSKFRGELIKQGRSLRSFFQRPRGGGGQENLDSFITRLANEASRRSNAGRAGFCTQASLLFRQLLGNKRLNLGTLVDSPTFTMRHSILSCGRGSKIKEKTRHCLKE